MSTIDNINLTNPEDNLDELDSFLADMHSLTESEASPLADKPKPSAGMPKKRKKSRLLPTLIGITCIMLIACVALLFLIPEVTIPEGITAGQLSIGGMTKQEAASVLMSALGDRLKSIDMQVVLPDAVVALTPQDTGVSLDTEKLLEDAAAMTAPGDLKIETYLRINSAAVKQTLAGFIDEAAAAFSPATYTLSGALPGLGESDFDESAPCPVLILNPGTPGVQTDSEGLYRRILNSYAAGIFTVDAVDLLTEQIPEAPDLSAIAEAVNVAAVDAKLNLETGRIIPGSYGLAFDEADAEKLLKNAAPGENVTIPMKYTAPAVLGEEAYFTDILGFCQTEHSDNEKRNTNLKLACESLNGVVLHPGDTLSYNETLGKRTEENGYQKAPAYSGVDLVDSLGGGICQVSSTLYLCSLYAELTTVERINHGFPVAYIPLGLDATVNWGSPDLKIRNDSEYPVKIVAEVQDDFVCIWILGTETRDYYVRMGFSSGGRHARSTVVKYDRITNEQISKEDCALSAYLDDVTSLYGEIGPNEICRYSTPREQEIPNPTPEALKAAKRNIEPNAHAE